MCFLTSSYLMMNAMIEDLMSNNIYFINEILKTKKNRMKTIEQLQKFLEYHSNVKQLSAHHLNVIEIISRVNFRAMANFSVIFELIMMAFMSWSLIAVCNILLFIQENVQYSLLFSLFK